MVRHLGISGDLTACLLSAELLLLLLLLSSQGTVIALSSRGVGHSKERAPEQGKDRDSVRVREPSRYLWRLDSPSVRVRGHLGISGDLTARLLSAELDDSLPPATEKETWCCPRELSSGSR